MDAHLLSRSGSPESGTERQLLRYRTTSETQTIDDSVFQENGTLPECDRPPPASGNDERKYEATKFEHKPPEGGWGWVVCVAAFWTNGTVFGIMNSFGLMYVALRHGLEKENGNTHEGLGTKASLVGSICIGMTFLMSPLAGILSVHFGIRKTAFSGGIIATTGMLISSFFPLNLTVLYLSYGLMLGLGCSLAYTPSLSILGHYFKSRLGLINGIVTCGSAVFTIIYPFGLKFCLDKYGLGPTMKILGVPLAVMTLGSLVFQPLLHHHPSPLKKYLSIASITSVAQDKCSCLKHSLNTTLWRNRNYVFWIIGVHLALYGYFVPFVHLPKHVDDILPGSHGEVLIVCIGATSGLGRLIFGKVVDLGINRVRLQQFSFVVIGTTSFLVPIAKQFGGLITLELLMGLFDGCFVCMFGPIAYDLCGPEQASHALGYIMGAISIPMTAGPPIAGFIYDKTGEYLFAFIFAGVPAILGAIIMLFIKPVKQHFPAVTEVEEQHAAEITTMKEEASHIPRYEEQWFMSDYTARPTTPLPIRHNIHLRDPIAALASSLGNIAGSFSNLTTTRIHKGDEIRLSSGNRKVAPPSTGFSSISTSETPETYPTWKMDHPISPLANEFSPRKQYKEDTDSGCAFPEIVSIEAKNAEDVSSSLNKNVIWVHREKDCTKHSTQPPTDDPESIV